MNPIDLKSATKLAFDVAKLTKSVDRKKVEIAVIPPFPYLRDVLKILENEEHVKLGAQTSFFEAKGAFTGAVAASMLASCGVNYVLVGHSERRSLFGESDFDASRSLQKILQHDMVPILCVGESKEEYELGLCTEICTVQLNNALRGLTATEVAQIVIAYEPIWAIGTGLSATPAIAQAVHASIRGWVRRVYGDSAADRIRIQYGGSVTPDTVDEMMRCPDIDGALVGGASLTASSFARIVLHQQ
eukprot:gene23735-32118_t